MNDHSLALHLLNTRIAGINGTIERLATEIHQAEIALTNMRATKTAYVADLAELKETVTALKTAMVGTTVVDAPPPPAKPVKKSGKSLDCE